MSSSPPLSGSGGSGQQQSSSWAQAAGKSIQHNPSSMQVHQQQQVQVQQSSSPPSVVVMGNVGSVTSVPSTAKALEQLNSMRESLFSQDGWGGQNVNQESSWDVPGSPEPAKEHPNGLNWKVNNGTDLWDLSLRGGGGGVGGGGAAGANPSSTTQPKAPWGHTPASNHGESIGDFLSSVI